MTFNLVLSLIAACAVAAAMGLGCFVGGRPEPSSAPIFRSRRDGETEREAA